MRRGQPEGVSPSLMSRRAARLVDVMNVARAAGMNSAFRAAVARQIGSVHPRLRHRKYMKNA
jgi:hypothetical protein